MNEIPDSELTKLFGRPQETFSSPLGVVDIWRPASGMVVTRVAGLLTEGGAASIESAVRRQVTVDSRHLGFHDWAEMTDYEAGARTRLTTLGVATLGALEGAHFLLRSRVVAFGVQIANVVVKKLTVHTTREEFERVLMSSARSRGRESYPGFMPTPLPRPSLVAR